MSAEKKKSSWLANRIMASNMRSRVSDNIKNGMSEVREAMSPTRLDRTDARSGWHGRHEDGGRVAFVAMAREHNLTKVDIRAKATHMRKEAMLYALVGLVLILAALYMMMTASGFYTFVLAVPSLIASLPCLMMAVRSDFSAWQCEQFRFGGLREYARWRAGRR